MESWLPWLAPPRNFLDELPESGAVILLDPVQTLARAGGLVEEESDLAEALADTWGGGRSRGRPRPALFLDLAASLPDRLLECPSLAARPEDRRIEAGGLDAAPGDPEAVARGLTRLIADGIDVVLAMDGAPAAARVSKVLGEHGIELPVVSGWRRGCGAGSWPRGFTSGR